MLGQLQIVQSKDLEIDALETEKQQTPEELTELRVVFNDLSRRMHDKAKQHDDLRQKINTFEMELATLTSRRKSASEAALNATSAKEAAQFQNQEIQFATRLQEVEEDTLPLMERMEVMQAELDELTDKVEELEPQLQDLEATEAARVKVLDEKISEMASVRSELAKDISASLLKQYDSIRRAKRGVGLAVVVDGSRCGGCNVKLPIHILQKAKKDSTGRTRCPSCGRILWYKQTEVDAGA